MTHKLRQYYVLIAITVLLGSIISYVQTTDKSVGILLFNTALYSLFIGLGLLYMDYVFTVLNKHQYMKYFYVFFILMIFYYIPLPLPEIVKPAVSIITFITAICLVITVLVANVYFYIKVAHTAKEEEEIEQTAHAIHIFSKAYERHKESKDPVEVQIYDFFTEKLQGFRKKETSS